MKNKKFTETEKTILSLIYNGVLSIERLAEVLFVSKNTIITHMNHIRTKLGCHSLAEIVYKVLKYCKPKGEKLNGLLLAEMGQVFEKYGYRLVNLDTNQTELDLEKINITIEGNNGQNN
jgi:DNA-binding CsgD family transcriptional regulator